MPLIPITATHDPNVFKFNTTDRPRVYNIRQVKLMARDRIDIFMETMSDWADTHRQALTKIDQTLATLVESQNNLTVKVDRLADRIDTLSQVTNAQQVIASRQADTVDRLVALVDRLTTKEVANGQ